MCLAFADIMNQVDRAMAEEEQERYSKILQTNMKSVQEDIRWDA